MLVYIVTNSINGKQYIGYTTKSLEDRKREHLYKSRCVYDKHYFYLFLSAMRKYGEKNFTWEVLCHCNSKEECCEKEIYCIKKYNTISPNGYNLTEGGNGGIQSEETKIKISNSLKEYWGNNMEKHHWKNRTSEERSEWAKRAHITKKENGHIYRSGFTQSEESRKKMRDNKNKNNKLKWLNIITNEELYLSMTEMSRHTGLSAGMFNHLKHGRQKQTKSGWTYQGRH